MSVYVVCLTTSEDFKLRILLEAHRPRAAAERVADDWKRQLDGEVEMLVSLVSPGRRMHSLGESMAIPLGRTSRFTVTVDRVVKSVEAVK